MAKIDKLTSKKPENQETPHRATGKEAKSEPEKTLEGGQTPQVIGDTPFRPPSGRHAAMLSGAASSDERAAITRNLQRTYGNQYVQRLIKSGNIQAKLTVGAADDPYEREANTVAEQVMSMPGVSSKPGTPAGSATAQREAAPEEEEIQKKPDIQRVQREEEEERLLLKPLVRRQEDEDEIQKKPDIQRVQREEEEERLLLKPSVRRQEDEDEIQKKPDIQRVQREEEEERLLLKPLVRRQEDEDEIQKKPDIQRIQREEEEERLLLKPSGNNKEIRRAADPSVNPAGSFEAAGSVEQTIESQKGSGTPLNNEVRSFMEPRFGADFSGVRVHTGSDSASLNRELSAEAFTHGRDIYMGAGRYSPGTVEGKRLLAHELTHVVQQTGTGAPQAQREPGAAKDLMLSKWFMATFKPVVKQTSADDLTAIRGDATKLDELQKGLNAERFAYLAATMMLISKYAEGARDAALAILQAQLANKDVARRMLDNGVGVVIVPRNKKMTDLAEFATLRGTNTFDGRLWDYVRGVGNVKVGSNSYQAITEENLLGGVPDPSVIDPAWRAAGSTGAYTVGYSTSTHEFAHGIHRNGLSDAEKGVITAAYNAKNAATDPGTKPDEAQKNVWVDGPRINPADMALSASQRNAKACYASRNEMEYFAQLSNAYMGTNAGSDPYTRLARNNGRSWVESNEPKAMVDLLNKVYNKNKIKNANPAVKAKK